MSRPAKKRTICLALKTACFMPQGISLNDLGQTVLEVDEMEAVRLADLEGFYQAEAARLMGISRQTFGNILNKAHLKIAEALIHGRAIRINCPKLSKKEKEGTPYGT